MSSLFIPQFHIYTISLIQTPNNSFLQLINNYITKLYFLFCTVYDHNMKILLPDYATCDKSVHMIMHKVFALYNSIIHNFLEFLMPINSFFYTKHTLLGLWKSPKLYRKKQSHENPLRKWSKVFTSDLYMKQKVVFLRNTLLYYI